MASNLNVLFAVSEFAGIVKTGGLADVAGALAPVMKNLGHDVRVIMPAYRQALSVLPTDVIGHGHVSLSDHAHFGFALRAGVFDGVTIYMIEHNDYFDRSGLYTHEGEGFGDNTERFAFFCAAALQACQMLNFQPHIIHGHDWQSALLPYYLKVHHSHNSFFAQTRSVLTIHNGAYQQTDDPGKRYWLGIGDQWYRADTFEHWGGLNILKGGIAFADKINTVSPHYADEMKTDLGSHGLVDALHRRSEDFSGILNGCDYQEWCPENDTMLPMTYSRTDLKGKTVCKRALQERAGLPVIEGKPVYGLVSRLAEQKGFAYLIPALWNFMHQDIQVVMLGSGDKGMAAELHKLSHYFPDKCRFIEGYDNTLAHLIEAGSDFFLMPSLFEPCGLNQMYSMKYGTLPIVRAVGGLVDSVKGYGSAGKEATGFMFSQPEYQPLVDCMMESLHVYHQPELMHQLIDNAMAESFTWEQSSQDYLSLYYAALAK